MRTVPPVRLLLAAAPALIAAAIIIEPDAAGAIAAERSRAPIAGEALIEPVESDLAGKPWVSIRASSGEAVAERARDGDPRTAWVPEAQDQGEGEEGAWLTLDLGGEYDNLRKVEIVFPAASQAHRYVVDVSSDMREWTRIADRSDADRPAGGAVHLFTHPGTRYLRITFPNAAPTAPAGVAELRVFNYLREDLVLGADLSFVDDFEERKYYVHPNPTFSDMGAGPHLLDVARDRGMDFVRLRVFNQPRSERTGELRSPARQGPDRTLRSGRWVKERGMQLGIDFHYADSWADPGKQPKPREWAELEFDELVTALHDFTYDFVRTLVEQGTTPDKVAVGNEIINGFLWGSESAPIIAAAGPESEVNPAYFREQPEIYLSQPGGRLLWQYWGSEDPAERRRYDEAWDRFATLVAAGISAVREASPETKVELHTIVGSGEGDRSGLEKTMEFWRQLLTRIEAQGQKPDVLAISYYPEWHGTVEQLDLNLYAIATTYPQYRVNIAETAYPSSGDSPQPNSTFPRTIQGQADAIQRVFQAANDVVNNRGVGVLLWEPASFQSMFRPVRGMENYFEPLASIDVFNRSHAREILEHRVYITAPAGEPLSLPRTVSLLTTADDSIQAIAVEWEQTAVPDRPGELTVKGMTGAGEIEALVTVM